MHCAMLETVMQMAMQCRDWCGALCNEMRAPEASHQGGHYSPGETHTTAVHCTKTKVGITLRDARRDHCTKTIPDLCQYAQCHGFTRHYLVLALESIAPGDPRTPAAVLLTFIRQCHTFLCPFFVQLFSQSF